MDLSAKTVASAATRTASADVIDTGSNADTNAPAGSTEKLLTTGAAPAPTAIAAEAAGHLLLPPLEPKHRRAAKEATLIASGQKTIGSAPSPSTAKARKPVVRSAVKNAVVRQPSKSTNPIRTKPAKRATIPGPANLSSAKLTVKKAVSFAPTSLKITHSKDSIMIDNSRTNAGQIFTDIQEKAKVVIEKGYSVAGEVGTLTKGNVEACMESGNILANGLKDLGSSYSADAQSAVATLTTEFKELAAVRSPMEFFKLQSDLMRRNIDAAFGLGAKNSKALLELAKETSAPLAKRASVVVDTVRKVA